MKLRFALFLALFACLPMAAQTPAEYRRFLILHEGCSTNAYLDKFGNWTIGIGHKLTFKIDDVLDETEIDNLFLRDLEWAVAGAKRAVPSFIEQPYEVRLIVVGLVYNVGVSGFYQFKDFRAAIEEKNYRQAALELDNSLWARQLPRRANYYVWILNRL